MSLEELALAYAGLLIVFITFNALLVSFLTRNKQ